MNHRPVKIRSIASRWRLRRLLVLLPPLSTCACSLDAMQRAGYAAVQNYGRMQCQQRVNDACAGQQSFDAYQQQRLTAGRNAP